MRIIRQTGWAGLATSCGAAVMAAGMSFVTAPAQAAFELPEGEKITHVRGRCSSDSGQRSLRTLRSEDREKLRHQ